MKIVIDLDVTPEDFKRIQVFNIKMMNNKTTHKVYEAVQKGIVLPKGHGDLIDRSKIYKAIPAEEDNCTGMGMAREERDAYNEGIDAMYSLVQGAPTIIEADKEAENEQTTD